MKRHIVLLLVSVLALTSSGSASQPKILEVTDNFGHQLEVNSGEDVMQDGSAQVSVNDEITISENANLTLCVSKVRAKNKSELEFRYSSDLRETGGVFSENRCKSWELSRSDYQDDLSFYIYVRNQDNISYLRGQSDFEVGVHYYDTELAESSEGEIFNYSTVKISQSVFERLKQRAESLESLRDEKEIDWTGIRSCDVVDGQERNCNTASMAQICIKNNKEEKQCRMIREDRISSELLPGNKMTLEEFKNKNEESSEPRVTNAKMIAISESFKEKLNNIGLEDSSNKEELITLKNHLKEERENITENLRSKISSKEKRIEQLESKLDEKEKEISNLSSTVKTNRERISNLTEQRNNGLIGNFLSILN